MKKYNILWFGPVGDPSGYGLVSRNYLKQLKKYDDLQIKLVVRSFWTGECLKIERQERELFEDMCDADLVTGLPTMCIYHLQPSNFNLLDKVHKHIGLTTFETDSVPEDWIPRMKLMNEIWTYTRFNEEVFSKKTGKPIRIVPHGVDSVTYTPNLRPIKELQTQIGDRFAFGSVLDWQPRKNPIALIEGFFRSFMNKDCKVCLVLKITCAYGLDYVKAEIKKIKQRLGSGNKYPEILLVTSILTNEQMPHFYNSLNAYVLVSKGEGWSLSHCEAMACELPTIGINWGGNTEFMTDENSCLLKYDIVQLTDEEAKMQPSFKGQNWAKVDMPDLISAYRKIYDNKDFCMEMGRKARQDILNWTWEKAGQKLHENIESAFK